VRHDPFAAKRKDSGNRRKQCQFDFFKQRRPDRFSIYMLAQEVDLRVYL
jgi:hypothetical protein